MTLFQNLKLLLALRSAETKIEEAYKMETTATKRGWKTTEFWGKVAVQLFTLFGAVKGFIDPKYAALIGGILEGVYTIGRSIVKAKGGDLPNLPAA